LSCASTPPPTSELSTLSLHDALPILLFECARPGIVALTTPNAEYNVMWETLPAGKFRHKDHRFEWTREQFQGWAAGVAGRYGYKDRKSTRLNSSHSQISYAVFCLKKK